MGDNSTGADSRNETSRTSTGNLKGAVNTEASILVRERRVGCVMCVEEDGISPKTRGEEAKNKTREMRNCCSFWRGADGLSESADVLILIAAERGLLS